MKLYTENCEEFTEIGKSADSKVRIFIEELALDLFRNDCNAMEIEHLIHSAINSAVFYASMDHDYPMKA